MKKKFFVLAVAFMVVAGIAGLALSMGSSYFGKVTGVKGNQVTIELEKGKASNISVGDSVELIKKDKAAGGAGMDLMLGC